MEVVNRWRSSNFERRAVEDVLAEDVEWVVPKRGDVITLRGIDAVLEWYQGRAVADEGAEDSGGPEKLDVSEERGELEDLGEGRVGSLNRLIYTSKESGKVAYVKSGRLVYTVRDGKIVRYELEPMRDESDVSGVGPLTRQAADLPSAALRRGRFDRVGHELSEVRSGYCVGSSESCSGRPPPTLASTLSASGRRSSARRDVAGGSTRSSETIRGSRRQEFRAHGRG